MISVSHNERNSRLIANPGQGPPLRLPMPLSKAERRQLSGSLPAQGDAVQVAEQTDGDAGCFGKDLSATVQAEKMLSC